MSSVWQVQLIDLFRLKFLMSKLILLVFINSALFPGSNAFAIEINCSSIGISFSKNDIKIIEKAVDALSESRNISESGLNLTVSSQIHKFLRENFKGKKLIEAEKLVHNIINMKFMTQANEANAKANSNGSKTSLKKELKEIGEFKLRDFNPEFLTKNTRDDFVFHKVGLGSEKAFIQGVGYFKLNHDVFNGNVSKSAVRLGSYYKVSSQQLFVFNGSMLYIYKVKKDHLVLEHNLDLDVDVLASSRASSPANNLIQLSENKVLVLAEGIVHELNLENLKPSTKVTYPSLAHFRRFDHDSIDLDIGVYGMTKVSRNRLVFYYRNINPKGVTELRFYEINKDIKLVAPRNYEIKLFNLNDTPFRFHDLGNQGVVLLSLRESGYMSYHKFDLTNEKMLQGKFIFEDQLSPKPFDPSREDSVTHFTITDSNKLVMPTQFSTAIFVWDLNAPLTKEMPPIKDLVLDNWNALESRFTEKTSLGTSVDVYPSGQNGFKVYYDNSGGTGSGNYYIYEM